ncbi:hypothetical protein [Neptunomonas sp.]|uniref:hypothetical protein n=1 Tax=Neptunomonas sp. TaxID=1971898 RepID=UPI0025F630A2|nr:hypothetical protein [Neptunomonas sp.]
MSKATALFLIGLFNILAIPAVGYASYKLFETLQAIESMDEKIHHDTATYYYFLGSILWVITFAGVIEYFKILKPIARVSGGVIVVWFIAGLAMANIIPYWLNHALTDAGYIACHDPREVHRTGRGESLIYQKTPCP